MRLIQLNLNKKVLHYLTDHVTTELKFPNPGLIVDIFCLLRKQGNGIPTDDVMLQLIDYFVDKNKTDRFLTSLLLKKQRHVLIKLEQSAFFRAMCYTDDPIQATRKIIEYSMNVMFRVSQAYCNQCHLNNTCQFYTHFRDITDISIVAGDSRLLTQVHDDCPRRPILDVEDMIAKGSELMAKFIKLKDPKVAADVQLLEAQASKDPDDNVPQMEALLEDTSEEDTSEEESVDDAKTALAALIDSDGYVSAGKGNSIPQYSINKLVGYLEGIGKALATEDVEMFALGQSFEDAFKANMRKDMFKNTDSLGQRRITGTTHKHSDLLKGKPEDLIHDDDVIDRKLAQGDMRIKQEQEQRSKKVHVYVLVDVSYSMDDIVVGHISRLVVAKTLLFSLIEKLKTDNAVFICRPFNDNIGERIYAETADDYEYAYERLVTQLMPGGGTDIPGALDAAMTEIVKAKDQVAEAEILLITDSEDRFDNSTFDRLKNTLSHWPDSILHVINASPINPDHLGDTLESYIKEQGSTNHLPAELVLRQLAKRFVAIDVVNGQLNVDAILNTITL